jgi:hypothetical protein
MVCSQVPEREVFATPALVHRVAICTSRMCDDYTQAPYLALARAVRVGDVLEFGAALTKVRLRVCWWSALTRAYVVRRAVRARRPALARRPPATQRAQNGTAQTHWCVLRVQCMCVRSCDRRIAVSYSRISLVDVAARLRLDSAADAESIVAKVACVWWWVGCVC